MTLEVLLAAGGLLAATAVIMTIRARRARSYRIPLEQISGDWLAQARAREENQW